MEEGNWTIDLRVGEGVSPPSHPFPNILLRTSFLPFAYLCVKLAQSDLSTMRWFAPYKASLQTLLNIGSPRSWHLALPFKYPILHIPLVRTTYEIVNKWIYLKKYLFGKYSTYRNLYIVLWNVHSLKILWNRLKGLSYHLRHIRVKASVIQYSECRIILYSQVLFYRYAGIPLLQSVTGNGTLLG